MQSSFIIWTIVAVKFCSVSGLSWVAEDVSPNCTEVRDAFADTSSAFTKCSVDYSRPITFCERCVTQYINVLKSYYNMSQVSNNGTPCIKNFVNLDRLGIIQTLYQNSVDLWTRAKCYECFVIENGTQTNRTSEEAQMFFSFYGDFQECLKEIGNNEMCLYCMEKYVVLQDYFLGISNENEKIGVCMDIVDMMNTTWTFWGDKCCKFRRHNEYMFIVSTITVLIVTVLFYIIAQLYAKKKLPTIIEQTRFLSTLDT